MPVVEETLDLPGGSTPTRTRVEIAVSDSGGAILPYAYGPDSTLISAVHVYPNSAGYWSATLVPNDDISPANTMYRVTTRRTIEGGWEESVRLIEVPDGAGPYDVQSIETAGPGPLAPGPLDTLEAEFDAHVADTTNVHGIPNTAELLDIFDIGTSVQPLDADLTAIAALATTAYGRALLTLANQAALAAAVGPVPFTASTTAAHFWYAGRDVAGNYMRVTVAALGADVSFDVRVEMVIPPIDGQFRRVVSTPMYVGFSTDGSLTCQINASDATTPGITVSRATMTAVGVPLPGARWQLSFGWDPTTDTFTLRHRASGTDLLNDAGWTLIGTSVAAGKQMGVGYSQLSIGGTSAADEWLGPVFRVTRKINGVLDIDVNAAADLGSVAPDAVTFTATVGGTVTVNRAAAPDIKLVSQVEPLEGVNTQQAIDNLGLAVARVLGRTDGILTGAGMPEGVVKAGPGVKYIDTLATNGAVEWVKASGTGTSGWRVVYGDTGWRNVTASLINSWAMSTGRLLVRRLNNNVMMTTVDAGLLTGAAATNDVVMTLPSGFTALATTSYFGELVNDSLVTVSTYGQMRLYGPSQLAVRLLSGVARASVTGVRFDLSWPSDPNAVPWPATLPGVAV